MCAAILFSLLVFLGWDSRLSRHWVGRHRKALIAGLIAIAELALFYAKGLPLVHDRLLPAPLPVRTSVTFLLLASLGLVIGIFFSLGVRVASAIREDSVPQARGIYGLGVAGLLLTTRNAEPLPAEDF